MFSSVAPNTSMSTPNSFLPILDSSTDKNCFSSNYSDSNFVDLISSDSECKSLITF